jgi:hypothetical protein
MVLRKSSVPSSKEGQPQVAVVSAYLRPPFLHRHKNKKGGGGGFASRFLVGTLVGWGSGRILRRFGRSLVTSFGGGSLIILVAHNRGYATLKWSRILDDLGRRHTHDDHEATMTTTTGHSEEEDGRERRTDDDALLKWWRVLSAGEWIHQGHSSLSLAGFTCGFLYNFFT